MRETAKTRPQYSQYQGRAVENVAVCETAQPSTKDSIISAGSSQPLRIADFLHPGAENGTLRRDLMAMTGYKDRELRLMIEAERRGGALILSDNKSGYFLASDSSEAQRFTRSMRHRAREILRTARAIEEAAGID